MAERDSFQELMARVASLEVARDNALREVQNLRETVDKMRGELAGKEPGNRVDDEPIREIVMDDWFISERTDKKHVVMFNEEKLKRNTMAMPPQGVDRYQHCTEPFEFIDVFLPSAVAWSSYGPDTVARLETAEGVILCYQLVEVNVNETLTSGIVIASVSNTCDGCVDSGGSSGSDSGDFPVDDGIRVTDVDCAGDGTGDLIVSYINERTGDQFASRKTGCCCDSGSGATIDEWIECGGTDAIYLNPSYFDDAPSPDPIIQLNGAGKCYKLNARAASGTETEPTSVAYMLTCSDTNCTHDACDATCNVPPTNSPTADLTNQGCPATQPNDTAFNPTSFSGTGGPGGTPLWTFTGTVNSAILKLYCSGATIFARLTNALGTGVFGAIGGPNSGYKDVTADVTCGGDGNLNGTFTLVNTAAFCTGGDDGTRSIVITL